MSVENVTCEQCGESLVTGMLRCPRCGLTFPVTDQSMFEVRQVPGDPESLTNRQLLWFIDPTREPWPAVRNRFLIILAVGIVALVGSIVFA